MLFPDAYEQAVTFAREPRGILVLYGDYGTGKTHLLVAIANARRERAEATLFASAVTLFDAIQDRIGRKQDYHDLLRRAIATPVFILDDVDKPKPSDFREEVYYQIIDGRTRVRRPIAVSCNCSPAALSRWIGGAARSRLMQDVLLVEMMGQDYRLVNGPPIRLGFEARETRFSERESVPGLPPAVPVEGPDEDEGSVDDPEEEPDDA